MKYIIIGTISFVFFLLFDVYTLKNDSIKKKIFAVIGLVSFIYSVVMVIVISVKIDLLLPLRIFAFVLWLLVTFLLIYSLFLELPFANTYSKIQHNNELVDNGCFMVWSYVFISLCYNRSSFINFSRCYLDKCRCSLCIYSGKIIVS